MLRSVLETYGHEVVEAALVEAALDIIQPGSLPDVVTTDLMMPTMGGVELIERLRSEPQTAAIPIVVISGSHETARDLQISGLVEAVVDKPFDAATLARCVRDLVGGATGSQVNDVEPRVSDTRRRSVALAIATRKEDSLRRTASRTYPPRGRLR